MNLSSPSPKVSSATEQFYDLLVEMSNRGFGTQSKAPTIGCPKKFSSLRLSGRLQAPVNAATEKPDSKVLADYCASDLLRVNWLYDQNLGVG